MASSMPVRSLSPAWKFALIGTVVSIPITVVLNWLPDQIAQADFGAAIFVFGAFAAGFVAAVYSSDPGAAGVRTGFIGALVGIGITTTTAGMTVTSSTATGVFFLFGSGLLLVVASLFGLFFGRIGGWVANAVEISSTPTADA